MNFLEYQTHTKRTCPDLGSELLNSLHMTVGMMTEVGEIYSCLKRPKTFDKINLSEELADLLWYFSNYATLHNLDTSALEFKKEIQCQRDYDTSPSMRPYDLILIHASDLLDYDKKEFAYKKAKNVEKVNASFISLFHAVSDMFFINVLDPYAAMFNNINKLKVRYPEKFTEENAINRNLEQERKELEK